jgi:hypothetical protein
VTQAVEYLLYKHKALNSNPSSTTKKEKKSKISIICCLGERRAVKKTS